MLKSSCTHSGDALCVLHDTVCDMDVAGSNAAAALQQGTSSPAPSSSSADSVLVVVESCRQPEQDLDAQAQGSSKRPVSAKGKASKTSPTRCSSSKSSKKHCPATRTSSPTCRDLDEDEDEDEDDSTTTAGAGNGTGAASGPAERKGPISHSTVEKQRRDRINTLIDLLAEEVPPVSSKYAASQPAVRRPKHVILSDTLALLTELREALKDREATIARLSTAATLAATPAGAAAASNTTAEPEPAAAQTRQQQAKLTRQAKQAKQAPSKRPSRMGTPSSKKIVDLHPPAAAAEVCPKEEPCELPPTSVQLEAEAQAVHPSGTGDVLNPDVSVVETLPGQFIVTLRCHPKLDLQSEASDGLSNLPVCVHDVCITDPGSEEMLMHAMLQVSALPGCVVSVDQVHLALYMSVCWGCPQLPPLLDGGLADSLVPCPWGLDAPGDLPQAWGLEAAVNLNPSSSNASMDSWYDGM